MNRDYGGYYPAFVSTNPEAPARQRRLLDFIRKTQLKPIKIYGRPRSHKMISLPICEDHTTYWVDSNGEPFVMTEPYLSEDRFAKAMNGLGMAWIRFPDKSALYGCGASTYLIASFKNRFYLTHIGNILWAGIEDESHEDARVVELGGQDE